MEIKQTGNQRKSVRLFLILAMAITWSCWIPGLIIGAKEGYIMPNFDTYLKLMGTGFENNQHRLLGILFQLGVYGPFIGALAATWIYGGRKSLGDLWKRIIKWKISGRWYLLAIGITFALASVPVVIFGFIGGFKASLIPVPFVLFVLVIQLFTSGLGEEPGWRGFLLPLLKKRFEREKYVWVLGLIWAIWHYPIVILQIVSAMQGSPSILISVSVVGSLAGYTMFIIGLSFLYAWLYKETQSLFLMIVFHAFSNTFNYWLMSHLVQPQMTTIPIALMPWLIVIILNKRIGGSLV